MLEAFFENIKNYGKLFSFWDVRKSLDKKNIAKMCLVLSLNAISSFAKILAPAALGKAVEMFATDEEQEHFILLELTPKELLFVSLLLSAWIKADSHIKGFLIQSIESAIIEKQSIQIIKTAHRMPLENHLTSRTRIPNMLMNVINLHSRLATDTVIIVYQVLLDISLGTILIWNRYGNLIGAEFVAYCFFDLILFNHLISFIAGQTEKFENLNQALNKYLNREFEILNFAETVRMFNHEDQEINLSKKSLVKYLNANSNYQLVEKITLSLKLFPFIVANIIPLSFIYKDKISISDLDDFIFLFSYLNMFSGNLFNLSQTIKSGLNAINSIHAMNEFLTENQIRPIAPAKVAHINIPFLHIKYSSPKIVFENVSYTYPNSSEPTLKGLNFIIKPGTTLGIIGRSNAGKSTIIKLLYGIFKPQTGTIKINDQKIQNIPQKTLCKIFCCVPQNPELFRNKSLKYNILYGTADNRLLRKYLELKFQKKAAPTPYEAFNEREGWDASNSVVQEADKIVFSVLKKVGLHRVNRTADLKSSTQSLSGGQRQRVSIARALVRNSSIFIFDEALSAQDCFTEREVLNNIKELTRNKTKIMITHRLSNLRDADEIIVLEEGAIIEQGSPEALLEEKGVFYKYWREQGH